ncbi:MAG: adenosylcobinamide-phosphate synthase CbiB [Anaerolineae bacterium]|nr:adenosylcobinamide-phosphate synthase CbiB [Anaerolineae bacterium]MCX8067207.1 adenosylcobinamide-phosphate synthase CbiB [Anaerolineae bacterium]MDW7990809.1 adenosylcobinamide-phosphate synthase CbiB [Anaerolineae bacterium]
MVETALTLLGAIGLDLVLGEPRGSFHPVSWMGWWLDRWWQWRPGQGRVRQFLFGMAAVLLGVALFALPWWFLSRASLPFFWLWSIPLLKVTFAIRALLRAGEEVLEALERGDLPEARRRVRWHLVGRETANLPESLVVSATVESLAENITDGLTGPLFYFALLGLPGAWAYRFCNTADSVWGHRTSEKEYIGKFAARADDVLNWIPARLTALLLVVGAALAGESPRGAWRTMVIQHRRTASPNAGWTMAAMAGALGVSLEKLGHYRLEGGDGPLNAQTVRRALRVVRWTMALVVGAAILLTMFLSGPVGK